MIFRRRRDNRTSDPPCRKLVTEKEESEAVEAKLEAHDSLVRAKAKEARYREQLEQLRKLAPNNGVAAAMIKAIEG